MRWYALYAAWAATSALYSIDRFLSLAKSFELWVSFVVLLLLIELDKDRRSLERFWIHVVAGVGGLVAGYFIVTIVGGDALFAFVGGVPKYVGFGGGPNGANGLTAMGAILALVGISRMIGAPMRRSLFAALLVSVACAVMLVSYSRTSMAIFGLMLIVLLYRTKRLVAAAIVSGAALIALLLAFEELRAFLLRGQDVNAFLSLTGRLDFLWVAGIAVYLMSPLLGHGYYAATTQLLPVALFGTHDATISNVDNSFLEVAMNLGAVGLALFVLVWLAALRLLWRAWRLGSPFWARPMAREAWLVLAATFLRSWVNPTIVYHHWNTVLFLFAVVVVDRESARAAGVLPAGTTRSRELCDGDAVRTVKTTHSRERA